MALRDDLKPEVAYLFKDSFTRRNGTVVPHADSVKLENDGVDIEGAVLYADLADSTALVDGYRDWFAAKIYKTFLHAAGKVVRSEGGVITAYDGDRIMAVFIGKGKEDAAVRAGMKIKWVVEHIVNPARLAQYPGNKYQVTVSTGIDTSKLFVAKTGVRGANDLVWIGRAANYAAKLAALPAGHTYITFDVYNKLDRSSVFSSSNVNMWTSIQWTQFDSRSICRTHWGWSI